MLEMSRIFVFIGSVGAGKSTQIKLLSTFLGEQKIKTKSATIKTRFPLTRMSSKLLCKIGVKHLSFKLKKALVQVDLCLNLFLLPVLSLYVRILKRLGFLLLIEEYLPGILVDYYHLAKIYKFKANLISIAMSILYKSLLLSGMSTILFVCDKTRLPERWKNRGTGPEYADYLESQQTIFGILEETASPFYHISTDVSVNLTFHNLVSAVTGQNYA